MQIKLGRLYSFYLLQFFLFTFHFGLINWLTLPADYIVLTIIQIICNETA